MLLLALMAAALAQPTSLPSVEKAGAHRLVIATPDYAVLDNVYPAKSESGFHLHPRELFWVVITPAKAGTVRPGQPERAMPAFEPGAVGMNVHAAGPVIHNVINHDDHAMRFVAMEIRRPTPTGGPITVRGPESRFVQAHDHTRLRAWRLTLQPGETAPPLTITGTGLRIFVTDGMLSVKRPDTADQALFVTAGQFEQLITGETRALTNRGTTPIQIIDVELK